MVNLQVTWTPFKDAESGIGFYVWSVGTSPCGTQLGSAQVNGLKVSAHRKTTLLNGMPHYVCVYGFNGAGAYSLLVSAAIHYDSTAPDAGLVAFGAPGAQDETEITTLVGGAAPRVVTTGAVCAFWTGFVDVDSGIHSFSISVQSGPSVNSTVLALGNIVVPTTTDRGDEFSKVHRYCWTEAVWRKTWFNQSVYARVVAVNSLGMRSNSVMSNLLALESDATALTCSDMTVTRVRKVPKRPKTYTIHVQWSACTAPSGVQAYAVGHAQAGDNVSAVKQWTPAFVSLGTSLELQVPTGADRVRVFVRATSAAGHTLSLSRVVDVDTQPPTVLKFKVGCDTKANIFDAGTAYRVQKTPSRACVAWEASDVGSNGDVDVVNLLIGSSPGGQQIMTRTQVESKGVVDINAPGLGHDGATYYATLQLVDATGNTRIVISDEVVVDASPPVISRMTTAAGLTSVGSDTAMVLPSRDACFQVEVVEAHSAAYSTTVEIRTSVSPKKLLGTATSVGSSQVCLGGGVRLQSGKTYDVTAVATNLAGVVSAPTHAKCLLDSLPPLNGWVRFAPVLRSDPLDPDRPVSGPHTREPPSASAVEPVAFQSDTQSLVLWLHPFSAASGMVSSAYALAIVPLKAGEHVSTIDMKAVATGAEKIALEGLVEGKVRI